MNSKSIANLGVKDLKRAVILRKRIESLERKLGAIFGGRRDGVAAKRPEKREGGMSAAGRARIAAAMKARWRKAKRAGRNAL